MAMKEISMEQLARYESAQETLGLMVAMRSGWIADEEKKANPDHEQIERWYAEMRKYGFAEEDLDIHDEAEIERVLATYNPIIRAHFERRAKETALDAAA
jgi:hypothetical protein